MARENLQSELSELQRRVSSIEARLGLLPPATVAPAVGEASTLGEQLVLKRELLILRRRVQVIEERLGALTTEAIPELTSATPQRAADIVSDPRPVPPLASTPEGGEPVQASALAPSPLASHLVAARSQPGPAASSIDPPTPAFKDEPLDGPSLERLIGGKWFGWIGSVAVVIGVGLLMKYGYDQHWFSVPPVLRCVMGAAFGLVLVGAGEVVRRRLNVVAAAGLLAAGVGTIYASAFAAYRLYGLLTEAPGMALLALAAGLGIAVGVRSRLVSVTALSLVGGYLAPFIIPGHSLPAVLPVFLLMLMTVGLTISAVLGGKFRALRVMVWWATLVIGGGWVLNVGVRHAPLSLTFLGLVWAGVHAELIWATRRGRSGAAAQVNWRPVLSSFSSTAWCVVLGIRALDAAALPDWIAPASLMSITAMLWLALAGALETLRETPRNDAERLGAAMFAQASGLLLVTIALAFSAWGEVLSWTALSLAAFVGARWLKTRALDVYAGVTLAITTARVLLLEAVTTRTTGSSLLGFYVSDWTAMAAFVGAAWVAGAFIMRRQAGRWASIANAMAGVGVVTASLALFSPRGAPFTHCVIAGGAAITLALLARARRSRGLVTLAAVCAAPALPLAMITRWWEVVTPRALDLLGLHVEPAALCLLWVAGSAGFVLWAAHALGLTARVNAGARQFLTGIVAGVGLLFAFLALYHEQSELRSLCVAWLVLTMIVGSLGRVWRRRGFEPVAGAALVPVTVLWVPAFAVHWTPSAAPFVLHPGLGVAGLIGVSWALIAAWIGRDDRPALASAARLTAALAIGMLVFAGTSLEAVRIAAGVTADPTTRGAALSMWWGALAVAMVAAGFWRPLPAVRWMGLGVLGVAMFKAVFLDLQDVARLWRIVSFIGLGLMMLVVPVVYSRMSHLLRARGRAGTLGA